MITRVNDCILKVKGFSDMVWLIRHEDKAILFYSTPERSVN